MQIKAGLKKELLFFSRSFRMWGVIIAVIAFAVIDPLMMRGLLALGDAIDKSSGAISEAVASDVALSSDVQAVGTFEAAFGGVFDAGYGMSMAQSDMLATSLLIAMLVLIGTAGGEQKKRSIIIPNTAGLTPKNYIIPKFVIYPLFGLIVVFLGTVASAGVSVLAFGGSIAVENILLSALCAGVYFSFMLSAQMMVGISTAKPGITVVIIYIASSIIPLVLSAFRVDKFNPFSLKTMAMEAAGSGELPFTSAAGFSVVNLTVSIAVSLAISVVLFYMTLLIVGARRVDNIGDESVL